MTGITGKTKLDAAEYNEMLRIANEELDLRNNIQQVVDGIKADAMRDEKDLIFYQQEVGKAFDKVFSAARMKLVMDSKFSDAIQTRIADNAQKLKAAGKGAK